MCLLGFLHGFHSNLLLPGAHECVRAFFDRCGYFETCSSPLIAAGDQPGTGVQFAEVMLLVQCRIDILTPSSAKTHRLYHDADQPDFVCRRRRYLGSPTLRRVPIGRQTPFVTTPSILNRLSRNLPDSLPLSTLFQRRDLGISVAFTVIRKRRCIQ